jgi:hypothetical protein
MDKLPAFTANPIMCAGTFLLLIGLLLLVGGTKFFKKFNMLGFSFESTANDSKPSRIIIILGVILMLLGFFCFGYSLSKGNEECIIVKQEAQQIIRKIDLVKSSTDQYDLILLDFIRLRMLNHFEISTCDSIVVIKKDIEIAKKIINKYE